MMEYKTQQQTLTHLDNRTRWGTSSLRHSIRDSSVVSAAVPPTLQVGSHRVCSPVVRFAVCEEILAVRLRVQSGVCPSAAGEWPMQPGTVLLEAAPQVVVQPQQLGILSFKGLLQEGRGWTGDRRGHDQTHLQISED